MKKINAVSSVRALGSLAVVQVALHAAATGAAADNLVSGGDFESVPQGSPGTACHSTGLPSVPGWSSNLGYRVDRFSFTCPADQVPFRPVNPAGGNYCISLQGSHCCGCNNNGWIEQQVQTVSGHTYRLAFDAALDYLDILRVNAGPASLVVTGNSNMGWRRIQLDFTAIGPSTIRLVSESGTGSTPNEYGSCWEAEGCLLDNVTLVETPTPVTCIDADLYRDSVVNGADLAVLLSYWGPTTSAPGSQACDLNKDGSVNGADLSYVLSFWGVCP